MVEHFHLLNPSLLTLCRTIQTHLSYIAGSGEKSVE